MKKFGVEPRPHSATTYYGGQVWLLSLSLSLSLSVCLFMCVSDVKIMDMIYFVSQCKIAAYKNDSQEVW